MPDVIRAEPETRTETRLTPLYRVLIHNDDVTPMDFVIKILTEVFRLGAFRSIQVMLEAHTRGVAHVVTEPLERAEFHVDQCRSLSRPRGFPLSLSYEPED
ncbi:MAG TPA: ATP-dependent Clp protease adaptor ClpS [Planctomycetota bacterium]